MGKSYYFDQKKKRYIVRFVYKGKRYEGGHFKTEDEAKEAVKTLREEIKNNTEDNVIEEPMPPKRKAPPRNYQYTVKNAFDFIGTLENPDGTKKIARTSIANLVRQWLDENDRDWSELTVPELQTREDFLATDIFPLINNYDECKDLIATLKKKDGEEFAVDTKKQVVVTINLLTQNKAGGILLNIPLYKKYGDLEREYHEASHTKRRVRRGVVKGYLAQNPEYSWTDIKKEFAEFVDNASCTNTENGRKNLRAICQVGLFVWLRPRRSEDWWKLQLYSKLPEDEKMKDKNILLMERVRDEATNQMKTKMTLYIDDFKNRYITRKGTRKEVLPRFVKELDTQLTKYLEDYIKKSNIRDNSRITPEERRENKEFYVFPRQDNDSGDKYSETSGYGSSLTSACKRIFNKKLIANDFRHAYQNWVVENLNDYTDDQLKDIAIECGDTWKDLPTNLRYRISKAKHEGKTKTQIEKERDRGEPSVGNNMEAIAEEGEGEVEQPEPVRPVPNVPPVQPVVAEQLRNLNNEQILDVLFPVLREVFTRMMR